VWVRIRNWSISDKIPSASFSASVEVILTPMLYVDMITSYAPQRMAPNKLHSLRESSCEGRTRRLVIVSDAKPSRHTVPDQHLALFLLRERGPANRSQTCNDGRDRVSRLEVFLIEFLWVCRARNLGASTRLLSPWVRPLCRRSLDARPFLRGIRQSAGAHSGS
jgi:hypothetical protein